jgi:hypothetical protein
VQDDDDDDEIGPRPPSPTAGEKRKAEGEGDEGEESDEGFEEDEGDAEQLPISHEIVLKDHTKVCCRCPRYGTEEGKYAEGRFAQQSRWTLLELELLLEDMITIRSSGISEVWIHA